MKHHLSSSADIVHNKAFESGVVKVQRNLESSLAAAEKAAIVRFRIDATDDRGGENNNNNEEKESYMTKVLANGKAKKAKKSNYRCMNHVSPTSAVVERLFSRAKLVMTDQRRCMDPSTLEAILMLRFNRDMWDIYLLDSLVLGVAALPVELEVIDDSNLEQDNLDDERGDEEYVDNVAESSLDV